MRVLLAFLLALTAYAGEPDPVVLLSFDGLSSAHFTPRLMPKVWKISEQGWRGEGIPPFPSTTFNGHASLSTGCWPGHHGVVANSYVEPGRGFVSYAGRTKHLQREPLWVAATRSGIRTAVHHWVNATGPWEGIAPWRLEPFVAGVADQDGLAFADSALAGGAKLVMVYLTGIDTEGHMAGPSGDRVEAKLAATDSLLAPWLERLFQKWPAVRVVLTADHGMAPMKKRFDLNGLLQGLQVTIVAHGGSAYVYLKKPFQASEVLRRVRLAGMKAWLRDDLPREFHLEKNPRVGQVVLLAPMGTWFAQGKSPEAQEAEKSGRAGAHGYMGDEPEMRTWLVVLGAGQGSLGPVPLWDIAPTIGAWLKIRWAVPVDGKPIPALP